LPICQDCMLGKPHRIQKYGMGRENTTCVLRRPGGNSPASPSNLASVIRKLKVVGLSYRLRSGKAEVFNRSTLGAVAGSSGRAANAIDSASRLAVSASLAHCSGIVFGFSKYQRSSTGHSCASTSPPRPSSRISSQSLWDSQYQPRPIASRQNEDPRSEESPILRPVKWALSPPTRTFWLGG